MQTCMKSDLFVPIYADIMSEPKLIRPSFWKKHQQTFFLEKTTILYYQIPEQSGQAISLTKQWRKWM